VKILVADDDADLREAFVEYLRDLGHEVDDAKDGFDALAAGRAKRYDIVLSDINMPRCDGWTVARMIKKQWPETRIFLCTGWAHVIDSDWAKIEEVERIFLKPFDLEELVEVLEGRAEPHAMGESG